MHLYVYYDVPADAVAPVLERVRAMQSELGASAARLLKRPEARAGVQTWMEIYDDVADDRADDFAARLADSADRHGLNTLAGPRHVERFVDIGSS